jgi:acyl-CoA thioester hydrolase
LHHLLSWIQNPPRHAAVSACLSPEWISLGQRAKLSELPLRGHRMHTYATRKELRIDWSEVDSMGHVNNLAIMRYVQTARVDYLERIGMLPLLSGTGLGPVMASVSCQFKRQLFYPGTVLVCSSVDQLKNTSFQMRHAVLNDRQEVVAEARDVIVMFDFGKDVKHPLPELYRQRIEALEAGKSLTFAGPQA